VSANDRVGLKAAFTNFNKTESDKEAELKLLGRVIEPEQRATPEPLQPPPNPVLPVSQRASTYQVATNQTGGLVARPLLEREAVRQLSFRCPVSIAAELRRKAAFNQLEQQEIIVEGIKRVLKDLPDPPPGWQS